MSEKKKTVSKTGEKNVMTAQEILAAAKSGKGGKDSKSG